MDLNLSDYLLEQIFHNRMQIVKSWLQPAF